MTRCADLKENLVLALEKDFAIVNATRHVHQPVSANQLLAFKAAGGSGKLASGLTAAGGPRRRTDASSSTQLMRGLRRSAGLA